MMQHKIRKVDVHLVSVPIKAGFSDATRKVETVGYTIVRVTTDQGLEGFGITYHEVGGEATKSLILKNMAPKLIGRSPLETEVIWQEFFHYLRGVGRKGLMFCALSAVDIALWDLKGKVVNLPLYKLLGGNKTKIPVYGSGGWTSYSDEELVDEMKTMQEQGYSMIKFKVGVEGAATPGGISSA
jgi:L-alanine-DL-glutamate epimerase-like enolase superfamily enzyme